MMPVADEIFQSNFIDMGVPFWVLMDDDTQEIKFCNPLYVRVINI